MTSIRGKLLGAFVTLALIATVGMAVGGFAVLRARAEAQAEAAFIAARAGIERSLAARYRLLEQVADLSYLSPVIRQVTARSDAADFGLEEAGGDAATLKELHDTLVDASFDWAAAGREGTFAVADYKGRVLYASAATGTWGGDTSGLPAVVAALAQAPRHLGSMLARADDARLRTLGLVRPDQRGLVFVLARAEVLRGKPQALFLQLVPAERLLADAPPGAAVSLVGDGGAADGAVPEALAKVAAAGGGPVLTTIGDVEWVAQGFPLMGPGGNEAVATLVVGQDLTAALGAMTRPALVPLMSLAVALILLAALAAYLLARRFTGPIEALEGAAQKVAAGDLQVDVQATGTGDEIDRLGRAFNAMVEGLRERERVTRTFKKYLAPDVVDYLLEHPEAQELGGSRKLLTVMFSDLVRFTALAEGRAPEEVVGILNGYFTRVAERIVARGGTVDKYIGDAVMAFFGAPVPRADHAARACLAALDHLAVVDELTAAGADPPLVVRIGVNTGEMIVGNIGGGGAQDYTVIGDAVNLAERVEAANRDYGTRLLVTAETVAAAGAAVAAREIDRVAVPGRKGAVSLCEIVTVETAATPAWREAAATYAGALAAYRARRFAEAAALFGALPDDPPAAVMRARAEAFAAAPPPEDWDGTTRRTEK